MAKATVKNQSEDQWSKHGSFDLINFEFRHLQQAPSQEFQHSVS